MIARVHINQHVIRRNKRDGATDPPITVKTYKGNEKAHEVEFTGPSRLVYRPDKPLDCGAHVWIEADREHIVLLPGSHDG